MNVQPLNPSAANVRPDRQDSATQQGSTTQQTGRANGVEPSVAATSQRRVRGSGAAPMAAPSTSNVNRLDSSTRSFSSCNTASSSVCAQTQYEDHPAAQTLAFLLERLSSGNQDIMPPAGRLKPAFEIALNSRQPLVVREEAINIILDNHSLEFGGTRESVPVLPRKLYKLANVIERTPALRHFSGRAEQAISSIHRELRAELSNTACFFDIKYTRNFRTILQSHNPIHFQ